MKYIVLTLAFLIFKQSLTFCSGKVFAQSHNVTTSIASTSTEGEVCHKWTKTCCKKKKSSEKKDCCGDHCKCICCYKVFFSQKTVELYQSVAVSKISQVKFSLNSLHSHDYHATISNPPQV